MMKVTIDGHEIEIGRRYQTEMYKPGGLICHVAPWYSNECPITLEICICPDGTIIHRGWEWSGTANNYLHTQFPPIFYVNVTEAMTDTVAGLYSGRIKVDGVKISVGASVLQVCPIDLEREEQLSGHEIYLG